MFPQGLYEGVHALWLAERLLVRTHLEKISSLAFVHFVKSTLLVDVLKKSTR